LKNDDDEVKSDKLKDSNPELKRKSLTIVETGPSINDYIEKEDKMEDL
jgi:hypothetical protein